MSLSPSRCSRSAAVLLILVAPATGCGGPSPSVFPSGPATTATDDERRKPDGVAIDPVSAPPAVADRADAAEGLITLRAPLGIEVATDAVLELFRRVVREDREAIPALFTSDAQATMPAAQHGNQPNKAVDFWSQRFNKLDYTRLAGEPVVRESELEIFRRDDVRQATGSAPAAIRAEALAEADVVVRVPIATPRAGQDRLLGDEMLIWLRREGDTYKIYRIEEEFQLQ